MAEIIDIQEKENPLFNRKEIIANIKTEASLSNSEASEIISKKTSNPIENIKIRQILGNFGKPEFKVIAEIYKTKEDKEKYVKKTKQEIEAEKKAAKEEEEKKNAEAEKAAEEKKEETENKQEETKESKPEETESKENIQNKEETKTEDKKE
ncbi:MAG: hypothetical protein ACOCUU_00100 [Nanoarchaeota archaeon]